MRITTALRYSLARMLIKSAGFTIVPSWVSRSLLVPAFDSLVAEGLRRNAVYFSCLSALAFSFPEPSLHVYADDSESAPPLPNHPMRRLFVKPNADMGEDAMQAAIIVWMGLGGNCYLHKLRNKNKQPIGLRPYHDGVITPVPSKDADNPSWVDYYEFRTGNGELKPIPREDIIHIKWPVLNPLHPWMAQPPILAAAREVDADNEATRYVATLLQNDAIPRTVITQSERMALTPEEQARMRAQWIAMFGRNGDQGGVAILETGAKIERLALNMDELNFAALHDIPEQRICAVMRVPAVVAGLGDDPTYANSEQAFKRFTLATLVPLWGVVASAIQAGLAEDFGNSVVVRHDTGRVQALQEDENNKWNRVTIAFTSGILERDEARQALGYATPEQSTALLSASTATSTPILGYHIESGVVSRNEARAQLGLPPEDETIDDKMRRLQALLTVAQAAVNVGIDTSAALRLVGLDPALATPPALPPGTPTDTPPKAHKARQGTARAARALQRIRAEVAQRMEPAIERAFVAMADQVLARAEAEKAAVVQANGHGPPELKALPDADDLIKPSDAAGLERVFRSYTVEVLRASWETWNGVLDMDVAFEESDPAVVAALAQAGDRIGDITETTRQFLARALQEGAEAGLSIDDLVDGIRLVIEESYQGRARAIARTEMALGQAAGTVSRFEQAGVDRVVIFDGGADDSDDICNQLNGTVQALAWYRRNPIQHPNCTRAAGPYYSG